MRRTVGVEGRRVPQVILARGSLKETVHLASEVKVRRLLHQLLVQLVLLADGVVAIGERQRMPLQVREGHVLLLGLSMDSGGQEPVGLQSRHEIHGLTYASIPNLEATRARALSNVHIGDRLS